MNAVEQPESPPEKAGCLIRAILILLPLGLAFMVPLSLWIYYQKKHQPAPATSRYAAILRKDLDVADFDRYVQTFRKEIGERSIDKPENLDKATAFIDSTMGFDNMGYAVRRQTWDAPGHPLNLIAELTGKTKPEDLVLVTAAYDEADATGIAAMMCVAHALAGTEHARTIRFAAVLGDAGMDAVRSEIDNESRMTIRKWIHAGAKPPRTTKGESIPDLQEFQIVETALDPADTRLERLRDLQKLIEQEADR